jgi:ADP-heptose:LPS heptosyltransferase
MKYVFRKKRYLLMAALLDAVGNVLIRRPGIKRTALEKISPKKILIVRLDHLGDVLRAAALPQALKENFPDSEVHFLTNTVGEALLRNNPYVNRVWVFNPRWYRRASSNTSFGLKYAEVLRGLRDEKFDLALAPRGDLRENHLLWAVGAKIRLGVGITGGGFFLTHLLPYAKGVHESNHLLNMLHFLGIRPGPLKAKLYWRPDEEENCRRSLEEKGFVGKNWVGIQIDAGTPAKEWPIENLEKLLKTLAAQMPKANIVFLGNDMGRAQWLDNVLSVTAEKQWLNLVGRTELRELFYLLRSLRLFVGPDSGPAHMAASCGVETLFLFSGTNVFDEWKALEESAYHLRHAVPCSPCHLTECHVNGHPCMSGIEASAVAAWLRERSHAC